MFETIKRLYGKTGNAAVVERAAKKGWITEEQAEEILPAVLGAVVSAGAADDRRL